MTPAGARDQRITVKAPPAGVDALGQRSGTWTQHGQFWAQAYMQHSQEREAANASPAGASVRFRLAYSTAAAAIAADMRVEWRGKTYAILGDPLDLSGARETIEIACSSAVAP